MKLVLTLLRSSVAHRRSYALRDLKGLAAFVLQAEGVRGPAELTLALAHPSRIQTLNRRFRGVDRPTDVISFRFAPPPRLQGDIAINLPLAALQARRARHSLRRELRLLFIHGILHLLGYTDYQPRPRRRMFRRQSVLLHRWESR